MQLTALNCRAGLILATLLAGSIAVTVGRGQLQTKEAGNWRFFRLDHQTEAVGTGSILGNFHRIEIEGKINGNKGEGELRLDSSQPALDEFGDRTPVENEPTTTRVTFSLIDRADRSGKGRKLYEITSREFPAGLKLKLVVGQNANFFKLVILDGVECTALSLHPRGEDVRPAQPK